MKQGTISDMWEIYTCEFNPSITAKIIVFNGSFTCKPFWLQEFWIFTDKCEENVRICGNHHPILVRTLILTHTPPTTPSPTNGS